jgi:ferredoxin-NADP reductase
MSAFVVKILEANFITHDVKRFVVEKPKGYTFIPGQATDVSINLPEWKDQLRPFTFTSLTKWDYLEFMIKIYDDHQGVTHKLGQINGGSELILHDVFGAIQYKGPGVFIAGGAGITPFIAIFRDLYRTKHLQGNLLINSNKTAADVIIGQELAQMLKQDMINVYTRENVIGFLDRRITRDFLIENIADFSKPMYVCGPDKFVADITAMLLELGATTETLVVEK